MSCSDNAACEFSDSLVTMKATLIHSSGFSQGDVEWLFKVGQSQKVTEGTVLIREGAQVEQSYLVIEGLLAVLVTGVKGDRVNVCQLAQGEAAGLLSLLSNHASTTTVVAITASTVLVIPHVQLLTKLQQDQQFAACFHRILAVRLSAQLRGISGLLVRSRSVASQPLKKVLLAFAELADSDIAWMVAAGQYQQVADNTVLIQEGQTAQAIYILLEGTLSILINTTVNEQVISKEIAKLSTGEIIGEMSLLDAQLPSATVTSVGNCFVLTLAQSLLVAKLQSDLGFAVRFYRAIAVMLIDRLQDRLVQHGLGRLAYDRDQPLREDEYEDELDFDSLDNVALAGARFDWLLKQVRKRS